MKQMPREEGIDHTLSFLREGYLYIGNRRRGFQSDLFATRLAGEKAICMGGRKAAELFYDTEKFRRHGAAPKRIVTSLFGKHSVQTLDDAAHKNRKDMLMSVMSKEGLGTLVDITKERWEEALDEWVQADQITLYESVKVLLCEIACEWTGVPFEESEAKKRASELGALFESAAAVGPVYGAGRAARNNIDEWIEGLVNEVRAGRIDVPENGALYRFAWHRDLDGNLLDTGTVAVEVVNLLRPIVAIAIYINFLVLALYHHPDEKARLRHGGDEESKAFIQEVRRFYPFFPMIAARVKKDFSWHEYVFQEGTLTMLDLYGTNHDPELWDNPDVFRPARFIGWDGSRFDFIPQGGGDYWLGHRCAGEWVTLEVMQVALDYLVYYMDYEMPDQDVSYSMVHIPSIPHSKVVLEKIKRKS